MKHLTKIYIIFIISLIVIIISLFITYKRQEKFDSEIYELSKHGGFYSQFFFLLSHFINCKNSKINFKINSENWTYKSINGWEDYFLPVSLIFKDNVTEEVTINIKDMGGNFSIQEYKDNIPELYKYNENTKNKIELFKQKFNLINYQYDYISIRRGDKISIGEAEIVTENKYLDLLLNKNPNCKIIFLQTDDYTCYTNIKDYINERKLNITVYTNSDATKNGANEIDIQSLNSNDIYEHTIDLISCVDIAKYANVCILEYSSNISRFIKLYHEHPENVYDVNSGISEIDYTRLQCPGYNDPKL